MPRIPENRPLRSGRASCFARLANCWRGLGRAGGVATEFAYIAPFMIALSYGIFEVAHYIYIEMMVQNSLQDGLHYANVNNSDSQNDYGASQVQSYVSGELSSYGITCSPCTVTEPSNTPGNTVSISIQVTYTPLMPGITSVPYIGQIFQLNQTITDEGTTTLTPGGIS